MPVDWKAPDSFTRLLAATVASLDGATKLNYKKIADFYGEGATYDAIEGRFRNIKKQASKLKEEVENGRPIAPPRGGHRSAETTPRKPRTPKNQRSHDDVLSGRVSKSTNTSPTKKHSNAQVKREMFGSGPYSVTSSSSCTGTDIETPSSTEATTSSFLPDENSFQDLTQYASFDVPQSQVMEHSFWDELEHIA